MLNRIRIGTTLLISCLLLEVASPGVMAAVPLANNAIRARMELCEAVQRA